MQFSKYRAEIFFLEACNRNGKWEHGFIASQFKVATN